MITLTECVRYGWITFKQRPELFIAAFLIYSAFTISSNLLYVQEINIATIPYIAICVLVTIFSFIFSIAQCNFMLKSHESLGGLTYKDMFITKNIIGYLITSLALITAIILGFAALIIPGIIILAVTYLSVYVTVDKGTSGFDALKESARLTNGNRWVILGLIIFAALPDILSPGLNHFFHGIYLQSALLVFLNLVIYPVSSLATVHAYMLLKSIKPETEKIALG